MPDSTFAALDNAAVEWLLTSDEPGIVLQVRRDLLGQEVAVDPDAIAAGPIASRLLAGQLHDGSFGVNPYQKWMVAHWRLVSLVELGMRAGEPRTMAALETVLSWISSSDGPDEEIVTKGRPRVQGSIYANALAVATRLGMARDARVRSLAAWLVGWQRRDGGWNCDRHPHVTHSSFYESITPMWALGEFADATGDVPSRQAADRAAEFFLAHRVFKSHLTDRPGDVKWTKLRYPEYWHFDYLHGLVMLERVGVLSDARCADAFRLLRDQQQPEAAGCPQVRSIGRTKPDSTATRRAGTESL